jgi:hypothetical protein
LPEELLLLTLNDRKGGGSEGYVLHLAAALVAELLLQQRLELVVEKRKKFLKAVGHVRSGDHPLDEAHRKIAEAKRRGQISTWVTRLHGMKRLRHRLAEPLVKRNILRMERDKVLFIFDRVRYPELNPEPERKLIARMRGAVLKTSSKPAARTVIILSLTKSAYLLKNILDKAERKSGKQRIAALVKGEIVGEATQEAMEAVHAAIAVAVIMPAVSSATMST